MSGISELFKLRERRPKFSLVLKLLVSVGLLLLVYGNTDLRALAATLSSISLKAALLIIGLYTLGQCISALKWRLFVKEIGLERSILDYLRAYFTGMFVNSFALGTVGGDVVRCLWLRPPKGSRAAALATAIADRVQGLFVLTSIGAVAILFVRPKVLGSHVEYFAVAILLALAVGWLFGPLILQRLFPKQHKFGPAAQAVARAFPTSLPLLLSVTSISLIFHFIQIGMHVVIAAELGAELSLAYLIATVPIVNIASALPISVNGLGIREALYIFLFMPMGVNHEVAVAFGAVWILSVTLVSALFGLLAVQSSSGQTLSALMPKGQRGAPSATAL